MVVQVVGVGVGVAVVEHRVALAALEEVAAATVCR